LERGAVPSVDRRVCDVLAIAARYRSRFHEKTDVAIFRWAIIHPARPGAIRFRGDERAALYSVKKPDTQRDQYPLQRMAWG